jgi:parvulin-like peptidyl-prolyl isomerase
MSGFLRSRASWNVALAGTLATVGAAGLAGTVLAQQAPRGKPAAPAAKAPEQPAAKLVVKRHLVNPTDPIALINGEPITRQQLADECVALKGEEVLESLIGRKLIEQAIKAHKIEVSPEEIDAEIDRVAQSVAGVSRETWLATLSKERKISPSRYAREIIYPSIALKKLASPMVQVTDQDIKDAFEAQFGERLKCRMILLNSLPIAKQVWEELKKNPDLFEKLAQEKSIDPETRSVGGLLGEAVPRHGYPRPVFDQVFAQLVDVDPKINPKDPEYEKYRPKDGQISGIIQVTDQTWAIFRREGIIPARPYDPKDANLAKQMRESILEAKIQEKIGELYNDMRRDATIENFLTGSIKAKGAEEPEKTASRYATPDQAVERTAGTAATQTKPAPAGAATAKK